MTPRSRWFVLSAIAIAVAIGLELWAYRRGATRLSGANNSGAIPQSQLADSSAAPRAAPSASQTSTPFAQRSFPPSPTVTPFAPPDEAALIEADKVNLMVRDYRTITGENPVGTNAEIMAAVMGGNPRQAQLGPPDGMALNEKGELIDRWGTPYFFHQLSRDHMEIRSAGADRVMWTDDDAVIK